MDAVGEAAVGDAGVVVGECEVAQAGGAGVGEEAVLAVGDGAVGSAGVVC